MITNQLMLSHDKKKILHLTSCFTPASQLSSLRVGGADVARATSALDLGVIINKHASMSQHVSSVCRSASFALYNIRDFAFFVFAQAQQRSDNLARHD